MQPVKLFRDCYMFELPDEVFPIKDWDREILVRSLELSETRVLDGSSATSVDDETHTYRLLDGIMIARYLSWLTDLYLGRFRELASLAFNRTIAIDPSTISQVNVNVLDNPEHSYDWHVDSNHCTGLLFCNSLKEEDGGSLVFRFDEEKRKITPTAGVLLFFDARDKPHTIEPIAEGKKRVTVVMNYNFEGEKLTRPSDLNAYLYS